MEYSRKENPIEFDLLMGLVNDMVRGYGFAQLQFIGSCIIDLITNKVEKLALNEIVNSVRVVVVSEDDRITVNIGLQGEFSFYLERAGIFMYAVDAAASGKISIEDMLSLIANILEDDFILGEIYYDVIFSNIKKSKDPVYYTCYRWTA